MEKAYTRINWVNGSESLDTPLNDDNLNQMDVALNTIDNRVVTHDAQIITLQGYETRAAQSASEAQASATAASISASNASTSASNASTSETNAHTSEVNASASETASATSESNAAQSEENAEAWAVGQRGGVDVGSSDETYHNNSKYYSQQASTSASNASTSETNAHTSEVNAATSESNASTSASNASTSASSASNSATAAGTSATNASTSETNASASAREAHGWVDNLGDSGSNQYSSTNNAYYWAMVAMSAASAGFTPQVVQTLPTTDISTSTIYFVPSQNPGQNNIYEEYVNLDGTVAGYELIGTTGVDLSNYLTKNGDSKDCTITLTTGDDATVFNSGNLGGDSNNAWSSVNTIASGETHRSLFEKISTMFKNVRTIAKVIGTNSYGYGTITQALDSSLDNEAEEYDPVSGTYAVGEYCIYHNALYKCKTAISVPESFDSTKWDAKTIGEELGTKQATLTFDSTPTSGSTNPVTSGGVYTYIDTMITQALNQSY